MANYDPKKIFTIVDGHVVRGFAEDSMVSGSRLEDKRNIHVGAQGESTFMKNANDAGEVTIYLAANSPSNQKLMELYNQDEPFIFSVSDDNITGETGVVGSECVVRNTPDYEKGDELSEREWTLIVADYEEIFNI